MKIIVPSAEMRLAPNDRSNLETECLFGEAIVPLNEKSGWVYCKLITDNYKGWVKKNKLGQLNEATHRVINIRTFIYEQADIKSNTLSYLPMGAKLEVVKIEAEWAQIYFSFNNNLKLGYVPTSDIINDKDKVHDWVAIAQKLENTPYRWGGRNTSGIDCSALLQLSYQTYGENIPRNTSEQIKLIKPNIFRIEDLDRGCVVFWKGHVGIMTDKINCVHANAFHMKTITEPLINIINRLDMDNKILEMMDFN